MASYFSSILTSTTSRVATLSSKFLASENDGETEDDTHLCRVLRAYYTEKGRALPGWLPPDPKAPAAARVAEPVYAGGGVGARYGGGEMGGAGGRGGSKMASLWDRGGQPQQQQQQEQQGDVASRAGRGAAGQAGRMGAAAGAGGAATRQNPFTRSQTPQAQPVVVESRPLPSQRAGSYQSSMGGGGRDQTPPGSSGGLSARDRMKQRFRQGGTGGAGGPGGGGMGEDGRADSYGSQGSVGSGGAGERPYVSANSPWSSSEPDFGSGGGGGGGGYDPGSNSSARRVQGLPSGPAAGRRGPGLPSGPRGMR